jgi:NAD-dependent SIR2 family protein deacetylase
MKREYTSEYVTTIRPLLTWTQCDKCHNEFKFEKMFKVRNKQHVMSPRGFTQTYCRDCAPNHQEAITLFKEEEEDRITRRPEAPPLPPVPPQNTTIREWEIKNIK